MTPPIPEMIQVTNEVDSSNTSRLDSRPSRPSRTREIARQIRARTKQDETMQKEATIQVLQDMSKKVAVVRRLADQRQYAGMLLAMSVLAAVPACNNIVTSVGATAAKGADAMSAPSLNFLVAAVVHLTWALGGAIMGLWALMSDQIHRTFAIAATLWTLTAFYTLASNLYHVGSMSASSDLDDQIFVPQELGPTRSDVKFVGSMASLGIVTYTVTLAGGVHLCQFAVLALQDAVPVAQRYRSYYRGWLKCCGSMTSLSGFVQILLGSYCWAKFGSGPYESSVFAYIFSVTFPEATIGAGAALLLHGIYTVLIAFVGNKTRSGGRRYQLVSLFVGLLSLSLQQLLQFGYQADTSPTSSDGSTPTCFIIASSIFPVWLEARIRSTPEVIDEDFYAFEEADSTDEDSFSNEKATKEIDAAALTINTGSTTFINQV